MRRTVLALLTLVLACSCTAHLAEPGEGDNAELAKRGFHATTWINRENAIVAPTGKCIGVLHVGGSLIDRTALTIYAQDAHSVPTSEVLATIYDPRTGPELDAELSRLKC